MRYGDLQSRGGGGKWLTLVFIPLKGKSVTVDRFMILTSVFLGDIKEVYERRYVFMYIIMTIQAARTQSPYRLALTHV